MCGGRMDYLLGDKKWMCYTCAHEEQEDLSGKSGEKAAEAAAPQAAAAPQDTQYQKKCPMCGGRMDYLLGDKKWLCYVCAYEEKEGGAEPEKPSQPVDEPVPMQESTHFLAPQKKKPCPACGKEMNWHEMEKIWRCPYCEYERKI